MTKFMPPKPDFAYYGLKESLSEDSFNKWYDKEIKPLFENAVKVTGFINHDRYRDRYRYHFAGEWHYNDEPTHKAILINIKPIEKEDTAENILRELFDTVGRGSFEMAEAHQRAWVKAQKYLENK